jgi:hypothetical protein
MKRLAVVIMAAGMMAVSTVQAGMADVGVRGGYMRMAEADDGAVLGGLFFRTDWREVVFIDGSLYYHSEEITRDIDLELIPIQLSAMLFLLGRDNVLNPFVLGGAGLYWTRTTVETRDTESEFDFGWHLGLGADFNLSDRMFIEGDFRYMWLDTDTKDKTFGESLKNFNHWIAGIGIGFRL